MRQRQKPGRAVYEGHPSTQETNVSDRMEEETPAVLIGRVGVELQ